MCFPIPGLSCQHCLRLRPHGLRCTTSVALVVHGAFCGRGLLDQHQYRCLLLDEVIEVLIHRVRGCTDRRPRRCGALLSRKAAIIRRPFTARAVTPLLTDALAEAYQQLAPRRRTCPPALPPALVAALQVGEGLAAAYCNPAAPPRSRQTRPGAFPCDHWRTAGRLAACHPHT